MPRHDDVRTRPDGLSRRSFLRGASSSLLGAGAVAATGGACVFANDPAAELARRASAGNFGRMFTDLPVFSTQNEALWEAFVDIGKPGGMLDAKDDLAAGPVKLITDAALSANNPNNPSQTAGTTFLGQFVDHDLTFDATSPLGVPTDPASSPNQRKSFLDLDSVYGGGPVASPSLYDRSRVKLRIESGGAFEDVPRGSDGRAILADPRNDEHVMICGLQAAFIKFHNAVVDRVRADRRTSRQDVFNVSRQQVRWHYQWIVLNELLPQLVGRPLVDQILRRGRRFYRPQGPTSMPVEFQGAAYRFGHSQVRPSYRANMAGDGGEPFFGMIFDPASEGQTDPDDMRGSCRAPRRFVGWQTFFDFGDGEVKPNKTIDTKLSTPLFHLPLSAIASGEPPTSLPTRNLLRHITWQLPSGQAIAARMGLDQLAAADVSELSDYSIGLDQNTPLWYYVLKEAEVMSGGVALGPVGGRIVAEVMIGVLQRDQGSFLSNRGWRPTLPTRDGQVTGDFKMVDLLTIAGVDPASRGQ